MEAIKNWLFSRRFIRREMYSRVFKQAQDDILETFQGDVDKEAETKAKVIINDLLAPVDLNHIVTLDKRNGLVYIGGKKATDLQLQNLKAESEFLLKSELWRILCETPKELAEREMFVSGINVESMQKGRSILYMLSTQRNILKIFSEYTQKHIASTQVVV